MRAAIFLMILLSFNSSYSVAQSELKNSFESSENAYNDVRNLRFNPDTSVITRHSILINQQKIDYTATAGTLPVFDENGTILGGVYYTYYQRISAQRPADRPLVFLFNGGPGCASTYLHMGGYGGPVAVNLSPEGMPVQPYGFHDNPYSILDIADLVYVDPLETGYSKLMTPLVKGDQRFFNLMGDIDYLSQWTSSFLARHHRWLSPKYMVGESYGSFRVAGLAQYLAYKRGIYLNGIVLVSSVLNYDEVGTNINTALRLPVYAEIAYKNNLLDREMQAKNHKQFLNEVNDFTCSELVPAIMKIGGIDGKERNRLTKKISSFTSVPFNDILWNNLIVDSSVFFRYVGEQYNHSNHLENDSFGIANLFDWQSSASAFWYEKNEKIRQSFKTIAGLNLAAEDFAVREILPYQCKKFLRQNISDKETQKLIQGLKKFSPFDGDDTIIEKALTLNDLYIFNNFLNKKYYELINGPGMSDHSPGFGAGGLYGQSFSAAINHYLSTTLRYKTDFPYVEVNWNTHPWNLDHHTAIIADLRNTLQVNPYFKIMFQTGFYDGPAMHKKLQQWQIDPAGKFQNRITSREYDSGHVMYIKETVRKAVNQDLRQFILNDLSKLIIP